MSGNWRTGDNDSLYHNGLSVVRVVYTYIVLGTKVV